MLSRILVAGQKHLRPSFLFLTAALALSAHTAQAADTKLTMGTGGKGGYYFSVGNLLCKSFAQNTAGYKCNAKATDGPRENLPKLRRGKFDLVVARSDWAKYALDGSGVFESKGPDSSLRSVFSIHSTPLNVIVRKGSGIGRLDDLNGKRVRLDRSATRLVRQFPQAGTWDVSAYQTIKPGEWNKQRAALCSGEIDALARMVGYPSDWIEKTAKTCPIQLLDVSGRSFNKLIANFDTINKAKIPANTYAGVTTPTETLGYKATLLSSSAVSDDDIYAFVKFTFESLPQLARKHPALNGLQPTDMIRGSLPAPLHPGAARYYREKGWIK